MRLSDLSRSDISRLRCLAVIELSMLFDRYNIPDSSRKGKKPSRGEFPHYWYCFCVFSPFFLFSSGVFNFWKALRNFSFYNIEIKRFSFDELQLKFRVLDNNKNKVKKTGLFFFFYYCHRSTYIHKKWLFRSFSNSDNYLLAKYLPQIGILNEGKANFKKSHLPFLSFFFFFFF